jgi:hypothetical protein
MNTVVTSDANQESNVVTLRALSEMCCLGLDSFLTVISVGLRWCPRVSERILALMGNAATTLLTACAV